MRICNNFSKVAVTMIFIIGTCVGLISCGECLRKPDIDGDEPAVTLSIKYEDADDRSHLNNAPATVYVPRRRSFTLYLGASGPGGVQKIFVDWVIRGDDSITQPMIAPYDYGDCGKRFVMIEEKWEWHDEARTYELRAFAEDLSGNRNSSPLLIVHHGRR